MCGDEEVEKSSHADIVALYAMLKADNEAVLQPMTALARINVHSSQGQNSNKTNLHIVLHNESQVSHD